MSVIWSGTQVSASVCRTEAFWRLEDRRQRTASSLSIALPTPGGAAEEGSPDSKRCCRRNVGAGGSGTVISLPTEVSHTSLGKVWAVARWNFPPSIVILLVGTTFGGLEPAHKSLVPNSL